MYEIKPLSTETWPAYAELIERHNGVWGGCWCTWFHQVPGEDLPRDHRGYKEQLVREGRAHAAVVFDGDRAIAWAQYGAPAELQMINHRKEYLATTPVLPDWRITCFFVDRHHRRSGVAAAALDGALALIADAGGGTVEAYPQDTPGKKVNSSFLYSVTRSMFEQAGFTYLRHKGKNHCVMRKVV